MLKKILKDTINKSSDPVLILSGETFSEENLITLRTSQNLILQRKDSLYNLFFERVRRILRKHVRTKTLK